MTVGEIPADAPAVAGYVNGKFVTFPTLQHSFPKAQRMSIAVTAAADAECLDIEVGDARPDQAPAWVRRQVARGVKRPIVYAQVSRMQSVLGALSAAGIQRGDVRVWTAHYTSKAHRCSSACGFGFSTTADATQWTDQSLGRNLDESLCSDEFFAGARKIEFTDNERRAIGRIQKLRSRPSTPARRAAIRACKATLLVFRAKLRAAAALTGWDRDDRRRRYQAILAIYKGE
ncbi:MAG: hypothetical protein ACJ76V_03660 [Thermoleophilaceae bacterium]